MKKFFYTILCTLMASSMLLAGNPDRQGEAGAYELLMNPWARSAGLHTMNTSSISGVEALRLNPAGVGRINKGEYVAGHTIYLQGAGVGLNAFGLAQKVGKSGGFGLSIMAVDFGDIAVTTTDQPEGTGATFSPNFFHLGLSYSHVFENKVSVGITFRAISETTSNLRANGFAIDAGVQYVTGEQDNFKFGISLRNIGSPMKFGGEGLSQQLNNPNGGYELTFEQRSANFELPSVLNIGLSYDLIFNPKNKLSVLANFTSNSFSEDQIGGGLEYNMNDMFMLRGGYKFTFNQFSNDGIEAPVYTGLSAGVSVQVPFKKDSDQKFGVDYAFRPSNPWGGSHNIAVRISM